MSKIDTFVTRNGGHKRTTKPWGWEIDWAHAPGLYVGKVIHVLAGHLLSCQRHEEKVETLVVTAGKCLLWIGEYTPDMDGMDWETLKTRLHHVVLEVGDTFHVRPGTVHRFGAGDQDMTVMEVSTDHLMDVVRMVDDHGRAGTNDR